MSLVGTKVGNILLEQRLGVGGMGEVYRGFDERLERSVAVKTIRADQRMSTEMKGRFLREARLLSRLGHPAICQVYDIIEASDADYLVLEFIEGETLRELIAPGLKSAQLIELSEQIAAALEVAHSQKVVHRDLKPENIMVTPAGRVKVLDFGIARSLKDEPRSAAPAAVPPERENLRQLAPQQLTDALELPASRPLDPTEVAPAPLSAVTFNPYATHYLTQAGSVIGTRYYMSPEQAAGGALTEASDLYSFGVVLEDLLEAYRHTVQHASKDERAAVGELDPDLLVLIAELKQKLPALRPTATQARERLRAIIERPAQTKRRQLLLRLSMVAGMVLLALLGLTSWMAWEARVSKTLAEQRTHQAESLIGFVIGDLRKKLEPIGRLDLIDGIGERALAYYAQVPTENLTATEITNLLDALRQLAVVRMKQGDYDSAEKFIQRALELSRARAASAPDQAEWQSQLCSSLTALGQWQGERELPMAKIADSFQQGLAACSRAQQLAPTERQTLFALAAAHGNVAMAQLQQGDRVAAQSSFLKSNELLSDLIARQPREVRYKEQLASNFAWLSQLFETDYRAQDALGARLNNLKLIGELQQLEPDSALWRDDLSIAQHRLAQLYVGIGDADAARKAIGIAQTLVHTALDADPENVWSQRAAAIIDSRAALLGVAGTLGNPLELATAARQRLAALLERDPDSRDYQRIYAQALVREIELRLRQTTLGAGSALADLVIAEDTLRKLLSQSNDDAESRLWLARALINSAQVLKANGDIDGGSAKLNEALAEINQVPTRLLNWEADWLQARALEAMMRREEARSVSSRLQSRGFAPL